MSRMGADNDGSDHNYRQRIDNVYQIRADKKAQLKSKFPLLLGVGLLGCVGIAYRVFVLNETPESVALPGGSFLVLLLATFVGHRALAARGTPSHMVLAVFLLLELGYVVASTATLVSISMGSAEQIQALTDDIPKVLGVVLNVLGLFLSVAAMAPAYSLRAACMPNANLKRR